MSRPNPERDRERRAGIRKWFEQWRKSWVCWFCWESTTEILEFYDKPNSTRPLDLKRLADKGTSADKIVAMSETAKCLCANCHAKFRILATIHKHKPQE